MTNEEIHVLPRSDGGWSIATSPRGTALSTHHEATEAARRALDCARERGAARVVLHDRYGRTRTTSALRRRA